MKAIIKKIDFLEEKDGNFGKQYNFRVSYDDKSAYYTSKQKEQQKFIVGEEAEFTEEKRSSKNGNDYYIIKPIYAKEFSNFNRAVKREQSKYSGFAMSYAKDLVVNNIIPIEMIEPYAKSMMDWMVEQDKKLSQ